LAIYCLKLKNFAFQSVFLCEQGLDVATEEYCSTAFLLSLNHSGTLNSGMLFLILAQSFDNITVNLKGTKP